MITEVHADLETLHPNSEPGKLLTAMRGFDSYLRAHTKHIPNYGERRRASEAISTAFTESAVNQVISKRMVKKFRSPCINHCVAVLLPRDRTLALGCGPVVVWGGEFGGSG